MSVSRTDEPKKVALKLGDMTAYKILHEQTKYDKAKPRAPDTDSLMTAEGTGRFVRIFESIL